jgi:hypothetical protein
MLFNIANLAYWIFLSIGVVLFILVILAGGGDDDLGVDTDVDVDVDIDVDADIDISPSLDLDTHLGGEEEFSPLEILGWLGIGKAPLMLLLAIYFSTWGVTGWLLNVILGTVTGSIPSGLLSFGVLILSLLISLFIGSLISRPLGKVFASFGDDISSDRLIGCVGTVTSKTLPYLIEGKIAQADVLDESDNLVTVSVSLPEWARVIPHRGEKILIIEHTNHGYIGIAKDSSDEDKWLNQNFNQFNNK